MARLRDNPECRSLLSSTASTADGPSFNGTGGASRIRSGFRSESMRFHGVQAN